jgi:uncharacterized protein (TIGR00725 family)
MKKYQIAIIGSAGANEYPSGWFNFEEIYKLAYNVGYILAKNDCYVITGGKSWIMEWASKWVKEWWWLSLGFIKWPKRGEANQYVDIEIVTNMWDWGDAFLLPYSADWAIIIWWWVGTLKEIWGFYLQGKPLVALKWTWWWADKLVDTYIDERNIVKIIGAGSAKEAVDMILTIVMKK